MVNRFFEQLTIIGRRRKIGVPLSYILWAPCTQATDKIATYTSHTHISYWTDQWVYLVYTPLDLNSRTVSIQRRVYIVNRILTMSEVKNTKNDFHNVLQNKCASPSLDGIQTGSRRKKPYHALCAHCSNVTERKMYTNFLVN